MFIYSLDILYKHKRKSNMARGGREILNLSHLGCGLILI